MNLAELIPPHPGCETRVFPFYCKLEGYPKGLRIIVKFLDFERAIIRWNSTRPNEYWNEGAIFLKQGNVFSSPPDHSPLFELNLVSSSFCYLTGSSPVYEDQATEIFINGFFKLVPVLEDDLVLLIDLNHEHISEYARAPGAYVYHCEKKDKSLLAIPALSVRRCDRSGVVMREE